MATNDNEQYIDLEDRKIRQSDLDKHMKLVQESAKKFNSKVSWKKEADGFRRETK